MIFAYAFNKARQRFSDVILQEGSGVAVIPTLAKKITSELAEVTVDILLVMHMAVWPESEEQPVYVVYYLIHMLS